MSDLCGLSRTNLDGSHIHLDGLGTILTDLRSIWADLFSSSLRFSTTQSMRGEGGGEGGEVRDIAHSMWGIRDRVDGVVRDTTQPMRGREEGVEGG